MSAAVAPVARAAMLIRRPVAEVFEAIVDPAVTTRFWFTKGSGRLAPGAKVRWQWEMYDAGADVVVKEFEPNRRLLVDWGDAGGMTTIEWTFDGRGDGTTFVSIENHGFAGTEAEVVDQAIGSAEGFAIVLAALKAYLEHGIELNLVRDRFSAGS